MLADDWRTCPGDLEAFLCRPTAEEWAAELEAGWPGSDGSSMSTDTIMGVRIGKTSRSYSTVDLPGNRHDWYYRQARRWRLPEAWRREADRVYRRLCVSACRTTLGTLNPLFWIAWVRAWIRYFGLRVGARFAWTQKAQLRRVAWMREE